MSLEHKSSLIALLSDGVKKQDCQTAGIPVFELPYIGLEINISCQGTRRFLPENLEQVTVDWLPGQDFMSAALKLHTLNLGKVREEQSPLTLDIRPVNANLFRRQRDLPLGKNILASISRLEGYYYLTDFPEKYSSRNRYHSYDFPHIEAALNINPVHFMGTVINRHRKLIEQFQRIQGDIRQDLPTQELLRRFLAEESLEVEELSLPEMKTPEDILEEARGAFDSLELDKAIELIKAFEEEEFGEVLEYRYRRNKVGAFMRPGSELLTSPLKREWAKLYADIERYKRNERKNRVVVDKFAKPV
jgi:hypothetical protein